MKQLSTNCLYLLNIVPNKEEINQRINKAKEEMNKKDSFDTILINDDLNKAKNNLSKIVSDFLINE